MTSLTDVIAFSAGLLLVGALFIFRSVRRENWRRRVLSWVGVVLGGALAVLALLLGYAGYTQRHTFMGPDRPTPEELASPVAAFELRLQEMPYLERLQEEHGPDGLVVVTLTNEARETAMTAAHQLPQNTINAFAPDQGALPQPFRRGFRALPTSYVIGRAGFIQEFVVGSREYSGFEALVEPYL